MTAGDQGPVLLCYDGSKESANAISRAGELLGPRAATVATVWSGPPPLLVQAPLAGPAMEAPAEGSELLDGHARERAERLAGEGVAVARAAGFEAQPLTLEQDRNVWQTLRAHALESHCDVVVVGARGRSLIATVLLGGVSSGLVHHAPVPVLVVPATASAPGTGPVVFCDDGSDDARRGIDLGRRLLSGPGLVLSLWRSWVVSVPYMAVGAGVAVGMAEEVDRSAKQFAESTAVAGAEAATAIRDECERQTVRFDGPPWRGLIEAANDNSARAIVVGARGLTGIARSLGSVSSAIAQHSPRPVLIVPPAPGGE